MNYAVAIAVVDKISAKPLSFPCGVGIYENIHLYVYLLSHIECPDPLRGGFNAKDSKGPTSNE